MTRRIPTGILIAALLAASTAQAQTPGPMQIQPKTAPAAAAINRAAAPAKVPTADAATAVEKANGFFNANRTIIGNFVQIGGDGRRNEGKIYVQKPGRMRFEYAKPATLEIVADGTSVAVRDRKLATQDLYFIGQTPLKFLLKDKIDLARDTKILDVTTNGQNISILIEDKATFGGTSRIKLGFDSANFTLKDWTITDPQGYETRVTLSNLDFATRPDPTLFKITQEARRDTF